MTPPEVIARLRDVPQHTRDTFAFRVAIPTGRGYYTNKPINEGRRTFEPEGFTEVAYSVGSLIDFITSDAEQLAAAVARVKELELDTTWQDHADHWQKKCIAAEARVRELEEAVRELSDGWRWSKSLPANPIARAAVAKKEVGGC